MGLDINLYWVTYYTWGSKFPLLWITSKNIFFWKLSYFTTYTTTFHFLFFFIFLFLLIFGWLLDCLAFISSQKKKHHGIIYFFNHILAFNCSLIFQVTKQSSIKHSAQQGLKENFKLAQKGQLRDLFQ